MPWLLAATAAVALITASGGLAGGTKAGLRPATKALAAGKSSPVAYQGFRGSDWDIFLANVGPGDPRAWIRGQVKVDRQRLTSGPGNEVQPVFSPNGRKIVFVRQGADKDSEIMMMNADGSDVERLTSNASEDRQPAFSSSGRKITFSSDRSGAFDIWTIQADGTELKRVSAEEGPAANPLYVGGSIVYEGPSVSATSNGKDALLSVNGNPAQAVQPKEILAFKDGQKSYGFSVNEFSGRLAMSVGEQNGRQWLYQKLRVGRCPEGCRDPRELGGSVLSFIGPPWATNPDFSPRGDWIAFQKDSSPEKKTGERAESRIYLMFEGSNDDGFNVPFTQPLTDPNERNANPDWGSP